MRMFWWSQNIGTTAKTLWDKFIVHYGLPIKILTDQGQNFESKLVADLCELMGMWKIQTSLYICKPMANVRGSTTP